MLSTARLRLPLATLVAALLTFAAAPAAHAGLSAWSPLAGLTSATGADWVRVYEHGPVPTTIYAGTEDDGVFVSPSAGTLWTPLSTGLSAEGHHVRDILSANGKVIAGTQAGLYLLNGTSWSPLAQGSAPTDLPRSVQALLSMSGTTVLAGAFAGGVYRSSDAGSTWTPPAAGNGMPPGETVWGLDKIGALAFASTSSGVYRSADGGASWTLSSDGIPPSATTLRIVADGMNPNILYVATGSDGMYRSINFGLTWSSISSGLGNGAVRGLSQESVAGRTKLYAATGDGLWVGATDNIPLPGPVTWTKATNAGLNGNTVFWAMDRLPLSSTLFAGTQANGGTSMTLQPPSIAAGGSPVVTASPLTVGATATASTGSWLGTAGFLFTYQWWRCTSAKSDTTGIGCFKINGATEAQYTFTDADKNDYVGVEVHAANASPEFTDHVAPSATTGKVLPNPNSLPGANQLSAPSVTMQAPGNLSLPTVGDTLVAAPGAINPKPAGTTVGYQWLRCQEDGKNCAPIPGATGTTYVIRTEDSALRIAVRERITSPDGTVYAPDSGYTNLIIPDPAANTIPPAIIGTAEVGTTLVGSVGAWKSPQTTYERTWLQCDADGTGCNPIIGATSPGFVVRPQDVGRRLRLRVTADVNESYKLPAAVVLETAPSAVVPDPSAPPAPGPQPGPGPQPQPGPGPGPAPDTTPPTLSGLKVTASKKGKTTIGFRSSERGSLTVLVARPGAGRKVGTVCKPATKKLRKQKRCTRYTAVAKATGSAVTGANVVTLGKKVGGKALKKGTYRVTITVRDAAGNAASRSLTAKRK